MTNRLETQGFYLKKYRKKNMWTVKFAGQCMLYIKYNKRYIEIGKFRENPNDYNRRAPLFC